MKKKSKVREFIETIITGSALAAFIIIFVVQGFYIPSGSMNPTLKEWDRILVNKLTYRFSQPQPGDIIVFRYDPHPSRVKRLIAVGGQTVEIKNHIVYVDDKVFEEPYLHVTTDEDFSIIKVPEGKYFLMGDNRNDSDDCRYIGCVPKKDIIGKAFLIYYPFSRIQLLDDYH